MHTCTGTSYAQLLHLSLLNLLTELLLYQLLTLGLEIANNNTSIVQIGPVLKGDVQDGFLGSALSMSADGTTLVVGSGGGDKISVYKYNPLIKGYKKFGLDIYIYDKIKYPTGFGRAVSMSADGLTIVVGAPYISIVRVYKYNEAMGAYMQFGPDIYQVGYYGREDNDLGHSVSMSGDGSTFVVGAPGGKGAGAVYIYKLMRSKKSYIQFGSAIDGEKEGYFGPGRFVRPFVPGDEFGYSVSISANGSTFVVGGRDNDGSGRKGQNLGHVRVYRFNDTTNLYAQLGSDIDGEAAGDNFGTSIAMSGDGSTFVVGAPYNNGKNKTGTLDAGHVRVYKFNKTVNSYTRFGLDIDGKSSDDNLGESVSISKDGSTFVVGTRTHKKGYIRVYRFSKVFNTYKQVRQDIEGNAEYFGHTVCMSASGSTFAVGAMPYYGENNTINLGQVHIYKIQTTAT
jgi:hypothetical protein